MPLADGKNGSGSGFSTVSKSGLPTSAGNTSSPPISKVMPGTEQSRKAYTQLMTPEAVAKLNGHLQLLNYYINHGYLSELMGNTLVDNSFSDYKGISLFRLTRLVREEKEDYFEKLISLYTALYYRNCPVAVLIRGTQTAIRFYLCVSINDGGQTAQQFEKLLSSSFQGTQTEAVSDHERDMILEEIRRIPASLNRKYVSSVSLVPSRRHREMDNNTLTASAQGIEKLIDSMQGKCFSAFIIAQPLGAEKVESRRSGYENMFTLLSPFAKESVSYGENESDATNYSLSVNVSTSISNSVSQSFGASHSTSQNNGYGGSSNSGFGGQGILGGSFNWGSGSCWNTSTGVSDGTTFGNAKGTVVAKNDGSGETNGTSHTTGRNISVNLVREIKGVQEAMQRLDAEIKRLDENRAFGMWDCCCYVVSEDEAAVDMAASNMIALMSGDEGYSGGGTINRWNSGGMPAQTQKILNCVTHMIHPCFIQGRKGDPQIVSPALMVSGRDLPVMLSLPNRSVMGTEVLTKASFGRNVPDSFCPKKPIDFGNIVHMGVIEPTQLKFSLDTFASHCFICGAAGSGKSNTTYQLINAFQKENVKVLVVEPAKGEYKLAFGSMPDTNVFTCSKDNYRMLYLNPFEFNEEYTNIKEHMDRLNGIFQTCWPMFGPLPGMIKDAIEESYIACGWDLKRSRRIRKGGKKYPTFSDMLDAVERIISHSPYPESTRGEYRGALGMRIRSMMTGFEETIFHHPQGLSDRELFEHNTIIDLSNLGSAESRSLVMGILIIRLREYRMNTQKECNAGLRHVTILEEAHNILKRCNKEQSLEGSNVQGAAVQMLTESIAEMRSSGEGFLIVDQSPTAVDEAAIKNTAIKIVMRLQEENDCKLMGTALSLLEDQVRELSKLEVGVAAVFHAGWSETVLGKMGSVWKDDPNAKLWSVLPDKNEPLNEKRCRSAIAQWVIAAWMDEDLERLNLGKLNTYVKWLRNFPEFFINANAWADLIHETDQFISLYQGSGLGDYDSGLERIRMTVMIGDFLRSFFQIDDLFRICPLEISGYQKLEFTVPHMLSKNQVADIRQWWREMQENLIEYIQFPTEFEGEKSEMRRKHPIFRSSVLEAEGAKTAMFCILRSYDAYYRKKTRGSARYMDAWMELSDYLDED